MPSLSAEGSEYLELPFDEEVVLAELNSCAPDKAPGLDGYTMRFFQKSCEFIKTDVMAALKFVHQHGSTVRPCNASFIALVPERKGAIELKDFRPISLIGSIYKLAAKVLAGRMKKVIGKSVSGQQTAFIKN